MKMTLPEFISELGDAEFARLVKAPIRTVQSWRRRERMPRPEQAREIIQLSDGRLDFEAVYGSVDASDDGRAATARAG